MNLHKKSKRKPMIKPWARVMNSTIWPERGHKVSFTLSEIEEEIECMLTGKATTKRYIINGKEHRRYSYYVIHDGKLLWVFDSTYVNYYHDILQHEIEFGWSKNTVHLMAVQRDSDIVMLRWDGSSWKLDGSVD